MDVWQDVVDHLEEDVDQADVVQEAAVVEDQVQDVVVQQDVDVDQEVVWVNVVALMEDVDAVREDAQQIAATVVADVVLEDVWEIVVMEDVDVDLEVVWVNAVVHLQWLLVDQQEEDSKLHVADADVDADQQKTLYSTIFFFL